MRRNTNMKYFNHAAYLELISRIKANGNEFSEDDLAALDAAMTGVRNYVNTVDAGEQQIQLAALRFEGEEYREMMTRYDMNRRNAHENAIAMTRMLNRIAANYGVDRIFTGNDQERLEVADFCLDVVVTLFEYRIM